MIINQLFWPFLFLRHKSIIESITSKIRSGWSRQWWKITQKRLIFTTLDTTKIKKIFSKVNFHFFAILRMRLFSVIFKQSTLKSNTKYGDFNWSESIFCWTWPDVVVRQLFRKKLLKYSWLKNKNVRKEFEEKTKPNPKNCRELIRSHDLQDAAEN